MKVIFLSANNYGDSSNNYGDCVLIDTGSTLVIYDCGCEEHANRVIAYMRKTGYQKAKFVLSHNDSDHFNGLPKLIDAGVISSVYTLLLLKYKKELLDLIDDGRVTENSLTEKIKEVYDNIYSLSGKVELIDALTLPSIVGSTRIAGPDKDTALTAVAKFLDNREGDTLDGETIYNAISFQLLVPMDDGQYLLLAGDSAYAPMESNVKQARYIQLPHHGKWAIAESIFDLKAAQKDVDARYFVSDNTGDTNGGSSELKKHIYGRNVAFTLEQDIVFSPSYSSRQSSYIPGGGLGN